MATYNASQDLVIEELDHIEGITEEEMTTVSYVCTCTCSDDAAPAPTQPAPNTTRDATIAPAGGN
jgi:hypothetical protein